MSALVSQTFSELFIERLSHPFPVFLGIGIATSAVTTIGWAAQRAGGVIRMIEKPNDGFELTVLGISDGVKARVAAFGWYFDRTTKARLTNSAVSATALAAALFTLPSTRGRPHARDVTALLLGALAANLVWLPLDIFLVHPTQKMLLAYRDAIVAIGAGSSLQTFSARDEAQAEMLLKRWTSLLPWRSALAAASSLLALTAMIGGV